MGYSIKLHYHPGKKEGLGFDSEHREVLEKKVGKPFEETGLEQLAAVVIAQMARRDVFIFDVEIEEYVRRPVSFKQSKDGKGIVLKGKKFSIDETARLIVEEIKEEQPEPQSNGRELAITQETDQLYMQPNRSITPSRQEIAVSVNQKKVLYWVFFEPYIYQKEAESKKLKFKPEKRYPVHQVIPHPTGNLSKQQIVVTDDLGRAVKIDEKFFTSAGQGLYGDKELGFSDSTKPKNHVKLMYEDELHIPVADMPKNLQIDNGRLDPKLLNVPDLRPGKQF
jgi:hypothetical protein